MSLKEDGELAQPEGMVTLEWFESPMEAQIAKGMLESAGVECFLSGENANSMIQAAFLVQLQVRVEDEAAARALLAQDTVGLADEEAREK